MSEVGVGVEVGVDSGAGLSEVDWTWIDPPFLAIQKEMKIQKTNQN